MRRLVTASLLVIILSVAGLVAWWPFAGSDTGTLAERPGVFSLVRPAFAQEGSFLDQEAGIAAYANVGSAINLENARLAFKVLEAEETDFLIGTVDVIATTVLDRLPHLFVHKDGWLVAYFLKDEGIGYAWPYGHGIEPPDDVLVQALNQVSASVGALLPSVTYYDFEFPAANKITVVNAASNKVAFEVQIPTAFLVFEASQTFLTTTGGWYPSSSAHVEDKTQAIVKGQFQSWTGALIVVYREP